METGELVLAILTFMAILVALGLGVANIVQTKQIQEREKRERLLNEIIEWAIDVCRCGLKPFPLPTSKMAESKAGIELYLTSILMELLLEYESISGRTEYLKRIALNFGGNLQSTVHSLAEVVGVRTKLIEEQIDILNGKRIDISGMAELTKTSNFKEWVSSRDWPEGLSKSFKVTLFKMEMNRTILLDNAKQVIEEATRIKTRDMGRGEENMPKKGEAAEGNKPKSLKRFVIFPFLILVNVGFIIFLAQCIQQTSETRLLYLMDGILLASTALLALSTILLSSRYFADGKKLVINRSYRKAYNWLCYSLLLGFVTIFLGIMWFIIPAENILLGFSLILFINQLMLFITPFIESGIFMKR
jgi:hypothetical protein